MLLNWLEGTSNDSVGWRRLDESLAFSGLFPRLRLVDLEFCPVVVVPSQRQQHHRRDEDGDNGLMSSAVESVLSENRRRVFPGLTASLGEKFMFRATGGVVFGDKCGN